MIAIVFIAYSVGNGVRECEYLRERRWGGDEKFDANKMNAG